MLKLYHKESGSSIELKQLLQFFNIIYLKNYTFYIKYTRKSSKCAVSVQLGLV